MSRKTTKLEQLAQNLPLSCAHRNSSQICELLKVQCTQRKMIGNAVVMSRIVYVIQLYGTAPDYLINSLQVLQNKAARIITKLGWGTRTSVLLKQLGWLSIKQLIDYHSLILVFKVNQNKKPAYLHGKFKQNFGYRTRQATGNCIQISGTPGGDKTKTAFFHRSIVLWNSLPLNLRKSQNLLKFKMELKKWIMMNIAIK